jgi:hypothetical protein
MPSKYQPLGDYLAKQADAGVRHLTMTFGQIEELLGQPLPATAWIRHEWWEPPPWQRSTQAWHGWRRAGWRAEPHFLTGAVTFERVSA